MIFYKLGFFGVDWDYIFFFDNKVNFQCGVNEVVCRVIVEFVDMFGCMCGMLGINNNLQSVCLNM